MGGWKGEGGVISVRAVTVSTQKWWKLLAKGQKEVWLIAVSFFGFANFWLVKLAKISLANSTFPKLGLMLSNKHFVTFAHINSH